MYGIINQAIKDLVVSGHGQEAWSQICSDVKVPSDDFVYMQYYPDSVTYSLIGSASQRLSVPAHTILEEFGKYWVLYTAQNGYGPLMDLFGSDYKSCLMNLNNLHARMGLTMPQLTPPRFVFKEEAPDLYTVEYYSERSGLSPMVKGLLEGLATKHNKKVEITFEELGEGGRTKTFKIKVLG